MRFRADQSSQRTSVGIGRGIASGEWRIASGGWPVWHRRGRCDIILQSSSQSYTGRASDHDVSSNLAYSARRILLVDADAFFVAVARLLDPEGVGKELLLIVGGSASGRGVVTSASYEARSFGVRSAMPTAQALRLCPAAKVVPVPRGACSRKSKEIHRALERFSPIVEAASIDEFYVDLSGTEELYHDESFSETAARMRSAVTERTSLSVSIGGGTSRLVAKLAAKRAKPGRGQGVHIVPPGGEAEFLSGLDLAEIPMIGPRFQERLQHYGLRTVRDALAHELHTLQRWFGERTGRWLYERVRGVDRAPVVHEGRRKSLSHEATFETDLSSDDEIERELLRMSALVAGDLRRNGLRARTVTVKLRDADFTTRQASRTLRRPVSAERPVHGAALGLLRKLRRDRRTAARLLGVSLSQLTDDAEREPQLSLFDEGGVEDETERDRTLAHVVDAIRSKYGRSGIIRAGEIRDRPNRDS